MIGRFRLWLKKKPQVAFMMCVPLLVLVFAMVIYPFFYAIYLSMLNKRETAFVGLANFFFLFGRDTFWMVVQQSVVFALTAVFFKVLIGFIVSHIVHFLPEARQRLWRGLIVVPFVMPPALSSLGWWWLFDPTHSAINWLLTALGGPHIAWLSEPNWARFSVILVNIWIGAPFFFLIYLAGLKSVPKELYESAVIDGATVWQKLIHVTIPMMRNIILIVALYSTIVTFANYDIVRVLTQGGPRNTTHMFATYAFNLGILSGDIPLGAAVSLFMFPILAVLAFFILRNIRERASNI
ncbi:MAG: sugar ABC transporter permease [SAR324 cluster bacterium]|nr:sugar ABC transporter permease [SAR324 cluster bacterium]MCZ6627500.1 sugar ABC transporter permease [SAR324 cluster bacterium]MCZ6841314.1 sugar ABC transporter permease [SAR324 cluster bacterium]